MAAMAFANCIRLTAARGSRRSEMAGHSRVLRTRAVM